MTIRVPEGLQSAWLVSVLLSIVAFALYCYTLAPGLTWSHFGADGGELIAAAVTNGVPHPPGYPLYTMILQGWLAVAQLIWPATDLARFGNLLSACFGASSVAVTGLVFTRLQAEGESKSVTRRLHPRPTLLITLAVCLAWATAPLFWKQVIITEVYAFHALLIALLGWALIVRNGRTSFLTIIIAFGIAHHLTFILLLPGVVYWLWIQEGRWTSDRGPRTLGTILVRLVPGLMLGLIFYLRLPIAASGDSPVNWGYADNWAGFWWLTSAAAYRDYLFGVPVASLFDRVAAWAFSITSQFTPVGLAISLVGLAHWDKDRPELRNLGLLWLLPVSLYSISYYTRDSTIYLLPCIWLMAIWLGTGLQSIVTWIADQRGRADETALNGLLLQKVGTLPYRGVPLLAVAGLLLLMAMRLSDISLRHDTEAISFVDGVKKIVMPGDIIISSADNETFALWYGTWASQEIGQDGKKPILINSALLQFDWYRRLVQEQYPELKGISETLQPLLDANVQHRAIYFGEENRPEEPVNLKPIGPLWRYEPGE